MELWTGQRLSGQLVDNNAFLIYLQKKNVIKYLPNELEFLLFRYIVMFVCASPHFVL